MDAVLMGHFISNYLGAKAASVFDRLNAVVRRFAPQILIGALIIFLAGCFYSASRMGLNADSIKIGPLAVLVMVFGPLSVLYAALGLVLLAKSADTSIPLRRAVAISASATLAEILPMPGGAIVRTGALIASGAPPMRSTLLVLVTAILWISLATLGCGLALFSNEVAVAPLLIALGGGGMALTLAWLIRSAGSANACWTLGHRLAGMLLLALRLKLAFLVLGLSVPLLDTFPFALAIIAGSAAGVVPAGLGLSEALAALLAGSVAIPSAFAFLAVAIDRLMCLGTSALATLIVLPRRINSITDGTVNS